MADTVADTHAATSHRSETSTPRRLTPPVPPMQPADIHPVTGRYNYGSATNWRVPPQEVSVATKFAQAKFEATRMRTVSQMLVPVPLVDDHDSLNAPTPYVPRLLGLAEHEPTTFSQDRYAAKPLPLSGHALAALIFAMCGLVLISLPVSRVALRRIDYGRRHGRTLVRLSTAIALAWIVVGAIVEYRYATTALSSAAGHIAH